MLGDDEIAEAMVVRLYYEGKSPSYIAGYLNLSYEYVLEILIDHEDYNDRS